SDRRRRSSVTTRVRADVTELGALLPPRPPRPASFSQPRRIMTRRQRRIRLWSDHRDHPCERVRGGRGVRVYAAQRKPVASGRGASGLAGRPPGGSSSLYALGATSLGASAWNKAASSSICPRPTP